jgi:hypothetical protein
MRLWVLALLFAQVAVARAEERRPVTLGDAIAAARNAPAAQVSGHEIAAAEANVEAAGAWPNPSVRFATNRLSAREVVGATVPLPVFGTVGAARRQAEAEAELVRAEAELVRRELRHRVVVAWVALARADGEVVATSIAAQQASELELIAKGRLAAGVGADVDVTVAGAARRRAEIEATAAERGEDAASAALAGVLGWDPGVPLRADGAPATGEVGELDARARASPFTPSARPRCVGSMHRMRRSSTCSPSAGRCSRSKVRFRSTIPRWSRSGGPTRASRSRSSCRCSRMSETRRVLRVPPSRRSARGWS